MIIDNNWKQACERIFRPYNSSLTTLIIISIMATISISITLNESLITTIILKSFPVCLKFRRAAWKAQTDCALLSKANAAHPPATFLLTECFIISISFYITFNRCYFSPDGVLSSFSSLLSCEFWTLFWASYPDHNFHHCKSLAQIDQVAKVNSKRHVDHPVFKHCQQFSYTTFIKERTSRGTDLH